MGIWGVDRYRIFRQMQVCQIELSEPNWLKREVGWIDEAETGLGRWKHALGGWLGQVMLGLVRLG